MILLKYDSKGMYNLTPILCIHWVKPHIIHYQASTQWLLTEWECWISCYSTSSTEGVPIADWEPQPVLHPPPHQHLHTGTLSSSLSQHKLCIQSQLTLTRYTVCVLVHTILTYVPHLPLLHCSVWSTWHLLPQHWVDRRSWECLWSIMQYSMKQCSAPEALM